jgi:hypothetical protein
MAESYPRASGGSMSGTNRMKASRCTLNVSAGRRHDVGLARYPVQCGDLAEGVTWPELGLLSDGDRPVLAQGVH